MTLLLEHQSKINSSSIGIPLFKAEAASKLRKSAVFSKKFYGKSLRSSVLHKHFMATRRFSFVARAVLTTDPASQVCIIISHYIAFFGNEL